MKNELYHHGIDGQRWGVTHGPPYPLSRSEHRAVVKSKDATEKRNISYRKSRKFAKRMSDEDLNATIDRLKREETYRQLVSKDKNDKAQKKEIKRQTKAIEKAQKKQESQKSKNQNDGTIKKSVKEALGGGIKTMGDAGFKALAKIIFPGEKTPEGKFSRNADGRWTYAGTGKESPSELDIINKRLNFLNLPTSEVESNSSSGKAKDNLFNTFKQDGSIYTAPTNSTLNSVFDSNSSWYKMPVSDIDDTWFTDDYDA